MLRFYSIKSGRQAFLIGIALCALSFFIPQNGIAVEVEGLYTGKILVNDKTQKTRVKAHRWAIEQVFTKVTGTREILKHPKIRSVVKYQTANYIKAFTFITDDHQRTFLVDKFDQAKIDALLRSIKASIWGKRRSETLIWLVIEEGIQRNILTQTAYPQLSELLLQSADDRGLPVQLPWLNRHEPDSIYSSDIWARFDTVVATASEQYQTDNYIMARMYPASSLNENQPATSGQATWMLDMQLMQDDEVLLKKSYNADQFGVIKQMINGLADYFASQYSIKSQGVSVDSLSLTINGIADVVSLVKAEKLITSLSTVKDIRLNNLHKNNAIFDVSLQGEGLDFLKSMDLLKEFKAIQVEPQESQVKTVLTDEQQLEQLANTYLEKSQTLTINNEDTQGNSKAMELYYQWLGATGN